MLFEPDDPAPKRTQKGTPPSPSQMGFALARVRALTKHITDPRSGPSYEDLYYACYAKTSKPVDDAERAPERQKSHGVEDMDTGAIVVHRDALRDELYTAYQHVMEAERALRSARGLCNHVARGLTERG